MNRISKRIKRIDLPCNRICLVMYLFSHSPASHDVRIGSRAPLIMSKHPQIR
jgi:hypothetical protein